MHGYVPKNVDVVKLTSALQLILDGGIYVPPSLADVAPRLPQSVIGLAEPGGSTDIAARGLTPRQRDVLELLVQGKPNKEIASALRLGEGTVKFTWRRSCGTLASTIARRLRSPARAQFCARCFPLEPQPL